MRHLRTVTKNLQTDRPLTGDDPRMVERRHDVQPPGARLRLGAGLAVGRRRSVEDHLCAERPRAVHLDTGRGCRHHHDGRHTDEAGRQRNRLRVVTRRIGDDAATAFRLPQLRDEVVGTADLERAGRLQVLALGPDRRTRVEWQLDERCLTDDPFETSRGCLDGRQRDQASGAHRPAVYRPQPTQRSPQLTRTRESAPVY